MDFYILVYVGVEITTGGDLTYQYEVQCVVLKGMTGWLYFTLFTNEVGVRSSIRIHCLVPLAVGDTYSITV